MDAGEKKILDRLVKKHKVSKSTAVAVFQDVQEELGWLSEDVVRYVSGKLEIPASQAFSVATFYSAFSLEPQGRNRIHVCSGTACHIKGAENVAASITRHLGIEPEQTTDDGKFSLHKVRCLGCCALAPVVKINSDTYADVSQEQVPSVLEKY